MSLKTRIADPGTNLEANVVESDGTHSLAAHITDGAVEVKGTLATAWHPDPSEADSGEFSTVKIDPDQNMAIRGPVLTDEGSYRRVFTDSLETTLSGTATFLAGSQIVYGVGTAFRDEARVDQYIKLSTDSTAYYAQVEHIASDEEIHLYEAYSGNSAAGSVTLSDFNFSASGTGASVANDTNVIEITSGTANAGTASIERSIDYLPISATVVASLDQRIADQETTIELLNTESGGSYCKIIFSGTSSNSLTFETANDTESESTSVTLTGGLSTDQELRYEIIVTAKSVELLINNKTYAFHQDHVPYPYESLSLKLSMTNSAVVTATTLSLHVLYFSNENIVQVANDFRPLRVEVVESVTTQTEVVTAGEGFSKGYASLSTTSQSPVRNTTYTLQSANMQISVASSSASDTSAGTGARSLEITYYTATLAGPYTETFTLNGTTGVNSVATDICHIEKAVLETVGSGGVAAGTISFYTQINKGGSIFASIATGETETQYCHHFVGSGVTCNISSVLIGNSGDAAGKASRFVLKWRDILTANSVDLAVSEIIRVPGGAPALQRNYTTPIVVPTGRLLMYVTNESANAYDTFASITFTED